MEGQIKLEAPTGLKLILFYFQAAATNAKTQPTRNRGSFMIHYIPSNTRSPYTLHITHAVWAPAWRSLLWGPIYTNCDSWKHIHTHTHTGGSFIITVTKSRKLDASSCLSTATTKHQTALPLRINIGIRSCQPQAANTTTLTLRDDREVKELRTSSSLMCPPVHKKVFQEQKRKIVNHRR